jgi:NADH dehydrogenase FAD-containing subunit
MAMNEQTGSTATTRRRVLAAGLGAAASAWIAGCATPTTASGPRVVVVGGGWGGAIAARKLASGGARVTLVEPNAGFMSCPLSAHVVVGLHDPQSLQSDFSELQREGVQWVRDIAVRVDVPGSSVELASGRRLGYDFLVLSPGIEYLTASIPGLGDAIRRWPVGFRAFETVAVRDALARYTGGEIVVTVPPPPYRCPLAPYERAAMFAQYIRRKGIKGKVLLLDANPGPQPGAWAKQAREGFAKLYGGLLEYQTDVMLESVNAQARTIETSIGRVPFAHANFVPPMQAPALIRDSGLGQRWASVNLPHFTATRDDRIYVIGDAAGLPLPKSGHLAFETGGIVAEQILARARGTPLAQLPVKVPSAVCYAFLDERQAVAVNVSLAWNAQQKQMAPTYAATPLGADQGQSAYAWGRSMWAAMFGRA